MRVENAIAIIVAWVLALVPTLSDLAMGRSADYTLVGMAIGATLVLAIGPRVIQIHET